MKNSWRGGGGTWVKFLLGICHWATQNPYSIIVYYVAIL